jgi:probable phosphoglycerate mutase
MSTRLWLVRHGSTDWSDAGRLNGWTDVSLNELGRRQSEHLREHLRAIEFDGIWSSDLARATETARLSVGRAVPDRRLRELDFGDLEGRTWGECTPTMQGELLAFDGFEAPRGESVRQLMYRAVHFADGLSDGDHLVFTHGGVIRALLRAADRDAKVEPGELLRVDRDASGVFSLDKARPFG